METFLRFNINPALVISLFPADTISGRLHVERDGWMALFGGPEGARLEPELVSSAEMEQGGARGLLKSFAHLGAARKPSVETLRSHPGREDDTASVSSTEKTPGTTGAERESQSLDFHRLSY